MNRPPTTSSTDFLFLTVAAASGFFSVALGAFAAHGLSKILSENLIRTFQTGVEYQATHTLALLAIALLPQKNRWSKLAGWSLIAGIILFSGSLYALALSGIRSFGMVTPFGGLFFLIGWMCLFIYAWNTRAEKNTDH